MNIIVRDFFLNINTALSFIFYQILNHMVMWYFYSLRELSKEDENVYGRGIFVKYFSNSM